MNDPRRWSAVVVFAIAMALLEAAVVTYLRTLLDRVDPYQPSPLPVPSWLMHIELARELSAVIMIGSVAWLAGYSGRARFGYFLLAFGTWDIFYYVFLAPMSGWPRSVLDWDVLFLIPLPWWGPVLAPVLIAALMVAGGSLITQFGKGESALWPRPAWWLVSLAGALLALYVFMADAIRAPEWTEEALAQILPVTFNWQLFSLALVLMSTPIANMFLQLGPGANRKI
ncbi:MAG: hypothetical protein PVH05_00160 [Burkholderiales bacterium]|jgi:hypothetical protein